MNTTLSPNEAWRSAVSTWHEAKATFGHHEEPEARALDAVMDVVAPDHAAMIEKLEIIKAELSDDYYIDSLIADARHLRDRARWDDLMSRYLAAKAAEDDYAIRVHDPMFEDNPCADTDERRAVADEMNRLDGIRYELIHDLLGATAPNHAALLWKLEYLLTDTDGYCWSDETVAPVLGDVRRILSGGI